MTTPAIEFRSVQRNLADHAVLAGVDLAVEPGETLALVGANGAGKSTLIRALLDLRGIDAGSIRLDGRPHTERSARARVAYLPERFQPPYYLRGRGFLEYMLALYGVRPGDVSLEDVCARLGLGREALDQSVQTFSKGMAQMLGLAACLLSKRPILVLDEPMSGLDPTARVRLQEVLTEQRDGGTTVLFTTHLLQDAEALADRIAVLHGGRIVAYGTPESLTQQYRTGTLEAAFVRCIGADARQVH